MTNPHPLTRGERGALLKYARSHGRTWKASLRADWQQARQPGVLQQLRNVGGPSWLETVKIDLRTGAVTCGRLPGRA